MSRDAYYDDVDDGSVIDDGRPSRDDPHMGDQTTGRPGYILRSRKKTANLRAGRPMKRDMADFLDDVSALWKHSSRLSKIKQDGVRASDVARNEGRNEGVKKWLQSMEDSTA